MAKNPEKNIVISVFEGEKMRIIFGDGEPTSEFPTHFLIQRYLSEKEPKNKVILHTHPEWTIILSGLKGMDEKKINKILSNASPEFNIFIKEGVGLIEYIEPGSEEIGRETLKKCKDFRIIIWKKHGTISIDENLKEAFDKTHIIEKTSKIAYHLWGQS